MQFIGRQYERACLAEWEKRLPRGTLSVLHGRRRVGKTRLIKEVFRKHELLFFEGLEGQSTRVQQQHFLEQLSRQTRRKKYLKLRPENWSQSLDLLADYVAERAKKGKTTVVFLDEFQWMAANRVDLVTRLKFLWDSRLADLPVHLILCGSISSFMVRKVVRSKALYGRVHIEILLRPLTLPEIAPLFAKRNLREVMELYMAIGGVPQYLEMVDPTKSFILNMLKLCFARHGYLVEEFERLFASHFGRNLHYRKILEDLGKYPNLSRDAIAKSCKLDTGGTLTQYLEELELGGFIERYVPVGRPLHSKILRYRMSDPYLLFYFRFIQPALKQIQTGKEQPTTRYLPDKKLNPWRGLAFERLCLAHADLIAAKLGFSAVSYEYGSWFRRTDKDPGAQIDLLFTRADNVVNLCEIKYRSAKSGKSLIQEVQSKIDQYPASPQASVEPILITASEVTDSLRNEGFFTHILTLEDLFTGAKT